MTAPSMTQKLFYLGGKRATPEHRDWLQNTIRDEDARRLGFLLALPNSVFLGVVGLFSLATGGGTWAALYIAGSLVILSTGALVPAFSRGRVNRIIRKNKFEAS